MCSEDSGSDPLLLGEERSYIPDKDAGIEAKLSGCVTARSSRAEFVVTAVIIGIGWWNCMSRNLPLSITARINRDITHYERERGRRCMSIGGDLGRFVVGASGLGWGLHDGEDLVVKKISER